ncbi:hypothetical protein M9Y10_033366 [Tritrichomonas musculus]|uniref:Uncharacterized protein n=1 Tax=Tritrichomonas musculus TaxID=1915356 RepID=A0ABR2KC34_9EUKA
MKKKCFSLTQNSPKRRSDQNQCDNVSGIPPIKKSFTLKDPVHQFNSQKQSLQFDHPDASPYVFSAILNSQNCRSARRAINNSKNDPMTSQPSYIFTHKNESDFVRQSEEKEKQFKLANRRQPPRTATFRARDRTSIQSKVPDERMMMQIKKEIESLRPKTATYDDSLNDGMFGMMAEPRQENSTKEEIKPQIRRSKQKQKQGPVGPSVTILSGKIIVDNEPFDINQKPVAAPLISTRAFCQDYVGVPNSLSFMM